MGEIPIQKIEKNGLGELGEVIQSIRERIDGLDNYIEQLKVVISDRELIGSINSVMAHSANYRSDTLNNNIYKWFLWPILNNYLGGEFSHKEIQIYQQKVSAGKPNSVFFTTLVRALLQPGDFETNFRKMVEDEMMGRNQYFKATMYELLERSKKLESSQLDDFSEFNLPEPNKLDLAMLAVLPDHIVAKIVLDYRQKYESLSSNKKQKSKDYDYILNLLDSSSEEIEEYRKRGNKIRGHMETDLSGNALVNVYKKYSPNERFYLLQYCMQSFANTGSGRRSILEFLSAYFLNTYSSNDPTDTTNYMFREAVFQAFTRSDFRIKDALISVSILFEKNLIKINQQYPIVVCQGNDLPYVTVLQLCNLRSHYIQRNLYYYDGIASKLNVALASISETPSIESLHAALLRKLPIDGLDTKDSNVELVFLLVIFYEYTISWYKESQYLNIDKWIDVIGQFYSEFRNNSFGELQGTYIGDFHVSDLVEPRQSKDRLKQQEAEKQKAKQEKLLKYKENLDSLVNSSEILEFIITVKNELGNGWNANDFYENVLQNNSSRPAELLKVRYFRDKVYKMPLAFLGEGLSSLNFLEASMLIDKISGPNTAVRLVQNSSYVVGGIDWGESDSFESLYEQYLEYAPGEDGEITPEKLSQLIHNEYIRRVITLLGEGKQDELFQNKGLHFAAILLSDIVDLAKESDKYRNVTLPSPQVQTLLKSTVNDIRKLFHNRKVYLDLTSRTSIPIQNPADILDGIVELEPITKVMKYLTDGDSRHILLHALLEMGNSIDPMFAKFNYEKVSGIEMSEFIFDLFENILKPLGCELDYQWDMKKHGIHGKGLEASVERLEGNTQFSTLIPLNKEISPEDQEQEKHIKVIAHMVTLFMEYCELANTDALNEIFGRGMNPDGTERIPRPQGVSFGMWILELMEELELLNVQPYKHFAEKLRDMVLEQVQGVVDFTMDYTRNLELLLEDFGGKIDSIAGSDYDKFSWQSKYVLGDFPELINSDLLVSALNIDRLNWEDFYKYYNLYFVNLTLSTFRSNEHVRVLTYSRLSDLKDDIKQNYSDAFQILKFKFSIRIDPLKVLLNETFWQQGLQKTKSNRGSASEFPTNVPVINQFTLPSLSTQIQRLVDIISSLEAKIRQQTLPSMVTIAALTPTNTDRNKLVSDVASQKQAMEGNRQELAKLEGELMQQYKVLDQYMRPMSPVNVEVDQLQNQELRLGEILSFVKDQLGSELPIKVRAGIGNYLGGGAEARGYTIDLSLLNDEYALFRWLVRLDDPEFAASFAEYARQNKQDFLELIKIMVQVIAMKSLLISDTSDSLIKFVELSTRLSLNNIGEWQMAKLINSLSAQKVAPQVITQPYYQLMNQVVLKSSQTTELMLNPRAVVDQIAREKYRIWRGKLLSKFEFGKIIDDEIRSAEEEIGQMVSGGKYNDVLKDLIGIRQFRYLLICLIMFGFVKTVIESDDEIYDSLADLNDVISNLIPITGGIGSDLIISSIPNIVVGELPVTNLENGHFYTRARQVSGADIEIDAIAGRIPISNFTLEEIINEQNRGDNLEVMVFRSAPRVFMPPSFEYSVLAISFPKMDSHVGVDVSFNSIGGIEIPDQLTGQEMIVMMTKRPDIQYLNDRVISISYTHPNVNILPSSQQVQINSVLPLLPDGELKSAIQEFAQNPSDQEFEDLLNAYSDMADSDLYDTAVSDIGTDLQKFIDIMNGTRTMYYCDIAFEAAKGLGELLGIPVVEFSSRPFDVMYREGDDENGIVVIKQGHVTGGFYFGGRLYIFDFTPSGFNPERADILTQMFTKQLPDLNQQRIGEIVDLVVLYLKKYGVLQGFSLLLVVGFVKYMFEYLKAIIDFRKSLGKISDDRRKILDTIMYLQDQKLSVEQLLNPDQLAVIKQVAADQGVDLDRPINPQLPASVGDSDQEKEIKLSAYEKRLVNSMIYYVNHNNWLDEFDAQRLDEWLDLPAEARQGRRFEDEQVNTKQQRHERINLFVSRVLENVRGLNLNKYNELLDQFFNQGNDFWGVPFEELLNLDEIYPADQDKKDKRYGEILDRVKAALVYKNPNDLSAQEMFENLRESNPADLRKLMFVVALMKVATNLTDYRRTLAEYTDGKKGGIRVINPAIETPEVDSMRFNQMIPNPESKAEQYYVQGREDRISDDQVELMSGVQDTRNSIRGKLDKDQLVRLLQNSDSNSGTLMRVIYDLLK